VKQFDPTAAFRTSLKRAHACVAHPPLHPSASVEEAALWWDTVNLCSPPERRDHLRYLATHDLFFLLVYLLNRKHFLSDERKAQWTFARCAEVQADPNNYIDLWPREHFKSEIITFGKVVQDILIDSNETFGLFSHTRPMAKQFLKLIKTEFETNELLKETFPDILYPNPEREAPKWSEDGGLVVRRNSNRKESTVEAWGLVDGQPTSKRFTKAVYDDVVARDNITDTMIRKTTQEFENSLLLSAADPPVFRYVGTYQEIGDTTAELIERRLGTLRRRESVDADGVPACLSDEKFGWYKQNLSPKVFALQILLDPSKARDENEVGFALNWIEHYEETPPAKGMNVYFLVDPAGNSTESNSRFAMWVIGLCADRKVRVLDMFWDKYDLEERGNLLFEQHRKWLPLRVGYEQYSMQSDIAHFHYRMKRENYEFVITALAGNRLSKDQRIDKLIPWFKEKRILMPKEMKKRLKDGSSVDLIKIFLDREYSLWPNTRNKDLLDGLARIEQPELSLIWPRAYGIRPEQNTGPWGAVVAGGGGSWLSE
jgi:hypothetical protein